MGLFWRRLTFLINSVMFMFWESLWFENSAEAILFAFLTVSIWWFIFLLPLAINYKDEKIVQHQIQRNIIVESFKKLTRQ